MDSGKFLHGFKPMNSFSFARMPKVHFGAGKISELAQTALEFGRHTLLVTGAKSLQTSGYLEKIQTSLHQAGIRSHLLVIDSEPSTDFIDSTCAKLRDLNLDLVIGIGGGSVIDGAKTISAMLPHTNSVHDHLEDVGRKVPHSGIKLPYIAVPTTSGTGGEMTKNAVISMIGQNGYKKSLRHDNLIPDAVIVDPELMLLCPSHITAACGMDAFTQLLEAYLSPIASPLTDALALSGIEKIIQNLIPACTNKSGDLEVRSNMAYASMLSGVVLANAGLGVVHGLASPIGGYFPVPHGVVCGTLIASATETNLTALRKQVEFLGNDESTKIKREAFQIALQKYAKVGKLFANTVNDEIAITSEKILADFLVSELNKWTVTLKLPRLSEYGITAQDFDRIVEKTSNRNNPIALEKAELKAILAQRL